jgi:hypothetical protein
MTLWSTYSTAPLAHREGQIDEAFDNMTRSAYAEGAIRAGLLLVKGTSDDQVAHPAAIPGADVDAFATAIASSLAAQTINGAVSLDGVIGIGRCSPARPITMVFDASADWDTIGGELRVDFYGIDANGNKIQDQIAKINGSGAVTLTTEHCFAQLEEGHIEASNGVGGTATIGVSNAKVEFGKLDVAGVAVYDCAREPASTTGYDYDNQDPVSVLSKGRIAVTVEHAVSVNDAVYVRSVLAGADLRGQFDGDAVSGNANFGRLLNARFVKSALADAVAVIEVF